MNPTGVVGASAVHRLDPRAKLLGLVSVTIIAVSSASWEVHAACALALLTFAAVARIPPRVIVRRARLVLLPVLLVALLAPASFVTVGPKAVIGVTAAVLLGATTAFPDVLHALERLRTPPLLVLIAALMYRYLFTIVEDTQRMRAAMAARGYAPRHALQVAALGRVVTALFLRTYDRAERVHLAMLARGFEERMPRMGTLRFGRRDALFLGALAPLLAVRVAVA